MQDTRSVIVAPRWLDRRQSILASLRQVGRRAGAWLKSLGRRSNGSEAQVEMATALKIASYGLVLMDADGQVVWTGEWDAGGVFEFGPGQCLSVWCGFTNHSGHETEINEYEVELMGEDGIVIERFNNSFGDSLIVPPGESRTFPAEWHM